MKNPKILYYFVIFLLFFIPYSACHPMEVLDQETNSHSDSSSHSGSEDENNDYKDSEAASLLAYVTSEDSEKPTRCIKAAALLVIVPTVVGAVTVMAPFANLTGYLFHDGLPVTDNSTCRYNATHNLPLLDQNSTTTALDILYTGGLGLVPLIAGTISAGYGGGKWVFDTARSIQQGFRNCLWPDQENAQKGMNPSIQKRDKQEGKKNCVPKRFKTLNYYMYSRPVEVINGLFWSEFYFNFIATALIANYPDDPVQGQILGYLLASISGPFVYHLYTHVTGQANERSFHCQGDQDNAQYFTLTLLKMMEQGKISDQEAVSFRTISHPDVAIREELENAWRRVLSLITNDNLQKVKIAEQRKTKYSQIGSFLFQGAQFPLKIFAQYMLTRKFCWALGASPDLAWKIAAPVTAVLAPFLGFGSLREQSLVQYELYQIPEYFSWPQSGYAVATRTGGILAAAANIPYWATPTWYAYQREILYDIFCHQYLINDLRIRAPLAALFAIPAWAVGRQFFECQFNRLIEVCASTSCCSGLGTLEEDFNVLTKKEKRDVRRVLQRALYLLRKSQYILAKKSYELGESMPLTQ